MIFRLLGLVFVTSVLVIVAGSNAFACMPPPIEAPERVEELQLQAQQRLWRGSASVFIARSENVLSNWPQIGMRAELVPLLQLKGDKLKKKIRISHREFSTCGPYPFLNALNQNSGNIFVVFSSDEWPTEYSVTNTMDPSFLTDPVIVQAWKEAYDAVVEHQVP